MKNQRVVIILLRLSIASVFLYAAVSSTLQPDNWLFYIPTFATAIIPAKTLLLGFSAFQAVLAIWILSGWKPFYAGVVSSLTFIAIILANFTLLDILFRDFAIFFASLALTVASYKKKS